MLYNFTTFIVAFSLETGIISITPGYIISPYHNTMG